MRSFSIGSLSMITGGEAVNNFVLQIPITGLDAPEYRTNYFSKPGEDGGRVSSQFYDKRTVTLTGVINSGDPSSFEIARQALTAACAINKNASGDPLPTRIAYTTLANNSYFFDAYMDRPIFDYDQPNYTRFLITMTVANPFISGNTLVSSGAVTRPSGGGFILPVILPIVSTAQVGGSVNLINPGNGNAFPSITLTGPLTSPFIYNQTAGKIMQLNYTIPAGSTVVIDMANKTIMLNGTTSLLSARDATSEWWAIVPGNNQITFNTSSTGDTGTLLIEFYPAWLGS